MIKKLFALIWKKWLAYDERDGKVRYSKIVRITGWRSCLYDTPSGSRQHATFCFWWFN